MPTVIEGVTYWMVPSHIVEDVDGNRVPNVTGAAYPLGSDPASSTPLQLRELSGVPQAALVVNGESKLPAFLVSAPEGIIYLAGKTTEFYAVPDILQLARDADAAKELARQSAESAAQARAEVAAYVASVNATVTRAEFDAVVASQASQSTDLDNLTAEVAAVRAEAESAVHTWVVGADGSTWTPATPETTVSFEVVPFPGLTVVDRTATGRSIRYVDQS